MIGEGAGIGPTLFLAEQLRAQMDERASAFGLAPAVALAHATVPPSTANGATAAATGPLSAESVPPAKPITVPSALGATPSAPVTPLRPLVLLGSNTPFPFRPRPSVIVVPGIPTGVIACMPLLEEWGIASRLASTADLPGCFEGTVTALADAWLSSLTPTDLADVEIFARGPIPMLDATSNLARRYNVPCQTSDPT